MCNFSIIQPVPERKKTYKELQEEEKARKAALAPKEEVRLIFYLSFYSNLGNFSTFLEKTPKYVCIERIKVQTFYKDYFWSCHVIQPNAFKITYVRAFFYPHDSRKFGKCYVETVFSIWDYCCRLNYLELSLSLLITCTIFTNFLKK